MTIKKSYWNIRRLSLIRWILPTTRQSFESNEALVTAERSWRLRAPALESPLKRLG